MTNPPDDRERSWRRSEEDRDRGRDFERGHDYERGRDAGGTRTYPEGRMTAGPYTGRGPRGYQRSDERIREDVCERLMQHGQIDASDIEVDVSNGEVTLKGVVDSRQIKRMAEDVADSVPGVKDVHNQLRIGEPQQRGAAPGGTEERAQEQPRRDVAESDVVTVGRSHEQAGRDVARSDAVRVVRLQIRTGMDVVGSDAVTVGRVKEVGDTDFLVSRATQSDIYVPFDVVRDVSNNQIVLNIPADHVPNVGSARRGGPGATR